MSKIIEILTIPIMLMNGFSAIAGGAWLVLIGEWKLLGIGIALLFTSHFILSFAMLPGMLITAIATPFIEKNSPLQYVFAYLSQLYTNILIVIWCFGSFFYCYSFYGGEGLFDFGLIPYALWSWGIALGPWQFFANKEQNNEFTIITTFSASAFYLLFMITLFLFPGLSLIVMMLCALVHFILLPIYLLITANKMQSAY